MIKRRFECAHCGATDVGSFEAGYAGVDDQHLCHPDAEDRLNCYELVTVFRHAMPCLFCREAIEAGIPAMIPW
jgi:hypothetical protein